MSSLDIISPFRSLGIKISKFSQSRWNIDSLRAGMGALAAADAGRRLFVFIKSIKSHAG